MTLRFRFTTVDSITILRGIACLIIIAIHSPLPNTLIHSQVGVFLTAIGHMAIRLFFFLSGFVLGKGYLAGRYNLSAKGIFAFYGKRIRKIVPLYYLTTLYLFVLTPKSTPTRFTDLFHLLTFTATPQLALYSSGYLWFISTLMQLYLLAPAGFFILEISKAWNLWLHLSQLIIILSFGAAIKWYLLTFVTYEYLYSSWQMNMDIFFGGMILAALNTDFFAKLKSNRLVHLLILVFTLSIFPLLYFISSWYVGQKSPETLRLQFFMIILPLAMTLMSTIVLSIFPSKRPLSLLGPQAVLQLIGIYSYEIYLLHQPVLSKLNLSCFPCTLPIFLINSAIVTSISIAIALMLDVIVAILHPHRRYQLS